MRILERYVLREVLATFLMALLIISGIFFLGSLFRALQEEIPVGQLLRIAPYLVPYTLPYTIPIGLLMAAALTFGRMAAENEITTLRASGVSMAVIVLPTLIVGFALSGLVFYLEGSIIPYCHMQKKTFQASYIKELLSLGKGRRRRVALPGMDFYCDRHDGPRLEGLVIEDRRNAPYTQRYVAEKGRIQFDEEANAIRIRLENVAVTYMDWRGTHHRGLSRKAQVEYELADKSGRIEFKNNAELKQLLGDYGRKIGDLVQQPNTNERKAWQLQHLVWMVRNIRRELHSRYVIAFAPLLFLLIGSSLPVLLNHDNRLVAFFIGFLLVLLLFFVPFLGLQRLAKEGSVDPVFLWGVVGLCASVGIGLTVWAIRGRR